MIEKKFQKKSKSIFDAKSLFICLAIGLSISFGINALGEAMRKACGIYNNPKFSSQWEEDTHNMAEESYNNFCEEKFRKAKLDYFSNLPYQNDEEAQKAWEIYKREIQNYCRFKLNTTQSSE